MKAKGLKVKANLDFEYCECGCHGSEAAMFGQSFWIFNDLGGPAQAPYKYFLYRGHGFTGQELGTYNSFQEAADAANRLLVQYITRTNTTARGADPNPPSKMWKRLLDPSF